MPLRKSKSSSPTAASAAASKSATGRVGRRADGKTFATENDCLRQEAERSWAESDRRDARKKKRTDAQVTQKRTSATLRTKLNQAEAKIARLEDPPAPTRG
jgi:hypothetical protein